MLCVLGLSVQRLKAPVAAEAVRQLNGACQIEGQENKVCEDTASLYNNDFFDAQTAVVMAVDNIESRMLAYYCFKK